MRLKGVSVLMQYILKVALCQKILEVFYIAKINIPNHYPDAENLNKLFTDLGGKFRFSAQGSDLEYRFWQCKNPPATTTYGLNFPFINSLKILECATNRDSLLLATLR